jgi:hypothetical protein
MQRKKLQHVIPICLFFTRSVKIGKTFTLNFIIQGLLQL